MTQSEFLFKASIQKMAKILSLRRKIYSTYWFMKEKQGIKFVQWATIFQACA